MKPTVPLNTIQRWMQSVIEHPGSNEEAWKSEEAQRSLPFEEAYANVLPSTALSPVERIGIYRQMFFLRMTESMAIDYPGVKSFLGEEQFDRVIVEEYIRKYPSQSYTLNHLGRHFPLFIQESSLPNRDFLYDLARLELSITNILAAEELPVLSAQQIATVPQEQWETITLIPIAALELLEFNHTVCDYLSAVNDEMTPAAPQEENTFAVVYRKNFRVFWEELSAQQYVLLSALVSETPFGKALEVLINRFPGTEETLQQELFTWFNEWVGNGLFSRIEVAGG
ncbi:MAG: DNA-binding domain-containing protein [Bacteroidota bacterium]